MELGSECSSIRGYGSRWFIDFEGEIVEARRLHRKIVSEDHHIFRDTVRKYIENEILPSYERWEKNHQVDREAWLKAGENGFLCPTAEQAYGGMEVDFLYASIITEELYYYGVPCFFLPLHNDIVFPYISHYATPEQKQRWVPGCVSGEVILALALTEPDYGSDLAALQTKAVKDGDSYVLNGSKTFISNGQIADLFVVAARTDNDVSPPHKGISLFLVEASREGFKRGRNLEKIGFHAQDTSEIFFENCRIPSENILGEENKGWQYLRESLQQERLVLAIGAWAASAGCLDLTIDYCNERRLFGKNLGDLQNTRFEIAEMATKVQLGQSYLDDLIPRHMEGEHLVREVSMAKYWLTETQFEVADRCLQLFGGYGYMSEYPVSRHFIDSRIQRIYGGANEVMKELIARDMGLERSKKS